MSKKSASTPVKDLEAKRALIRKKIGKQRKLDFSAYNIPEGFTPIFEVDRGNALAEWQQLGAQFYENKAENFGDHSEDRKNSSYVKIYAGTDNNGKDEYQYLMIIPNDIYQMIIEEKNRAAQAPIEAMRQKAVRGAAERQGGENNETYAPYVDTGVGINQVSSS